MPGDVQPKDFTDFSWSDGQMLDAEQALRANLAVTGLPPTASPVLSLIDCLRRERKANADLRAACARLEAVVAKVGSPEARH